jgi:predicted dehydrogenase
MAKSKIRIGILGSGSMGAEHANAYRAIENIEVASVVSRSQQRAKAVAQVCGAKPITDASALLNDQSIDAIDVCLPSVIHSKFVIPALAEGKHVFSETPFALELAEAESMIHAARKFDRVLLVGLLIRSIAQYEYVRRVADSGEHGKILSLTTYRLDSYLRTDDIGHKEHYSDPSTELMTFDFDFIQWILGAPTRLSATAVKTDRGAP